MKTFKLILPAFAMMLSLGIGAQTTFDAAKLYEEELNGTARYVGMGGAMSALGSDPSVISHNPAGIGTYRKSDINASLSIFGTSVNTDPAYTSSNQGAVGNIRYYSDNLKSDINPSFDNVSFILSGSDNGDKYMNSIALVECVDGELHLVLFDDAIERYGIKVEHENAAPEVW
jgi:hypothetical protein